MAISFFLAASSPFQNFTKLIGLGFDIHFQKKIELVFSGLTPKEKRFPPTATKSASIQILKIYYAIVL